MSRLSFFRDEETRTIDVHATRSQGIQMVFFLALLPPDEVRTFLQWTEEHLSKQKQDFQVCFQPALRGLALASEGFLLDDKSAATHEARRLLGWSKERHWLLG